MKRIICLCHVTHLFDCVYLTFIVKELDTLGLN